MQTPFAPYEIRALNLESLKLCRVYVLLKSKAESGYYQEGLWHAYLVTPHNHLEAPFDYVIDTVQGEGVPPEVCGMVQAYCPVHVDESQLGNALYTMSERQMSLVHKKFGDMIMGESWTLTPEQAALSDISIDIVMTIQNAIPDRSVLT